MRTTQGAICGAILYEGWAKTLEAAEKLAASGGVALEPCHAHRAVGPMAGIISPSMPVWVVENTAAGNRAFCNVNEGLGKVLRFGANSPEVLDRLRWLGSEFFAAMQVAVRGLADADLKPLMAQALHMGDELHNRNAAASGLLFKRLTLSLLGSKLDEPRDQTRAHVRSRQRPLLPQPVDGGLQVDVGRRSWRARKQHGHGDGAQRRQLRHPPERHRRQVVPGASQSGQRPLLPRLHVEDAAADLGDSAITETNGLGGFAMAASPAIVQFVGGTPADATANSRRMLSITLGSNPAFTLPALNFGGTPAGIDARLVVDAGFCRSSIPESRTRRPASARSALALPPRLWNASWERSTRSRRPGSRRKVGDLVGGLVVVALGGNALVRDKAHQSIPDQYATITSVAPHLVDLVEAGWNLVSPTATAPRLASSCAVPSSPTARWTPLPIDYAVGDTQGAIGYMFLKALGNELLRGIDKPVVALVTQTVVSLDDPAFAHPDEARRRIHGRGDRGGSPASSDGPSSRTLAAAGDAPSPRRCPSRSSSCRSSVGCATRGPSWSPPAVVASRRPRYAGALSGGEAGWTRFSRRPCWPPSSGGPADHPDCRRRGRRGLRDAGQRWLSHLSVAQAVALVEQGHLGEGSMRPKVQALVSFVSVVPAPPE